MTWVAICDKTGLLTDVIAATNIGSVPGIVPTEVGATCGVLLSLLSVIKKRHKSSQRGITRCILNRV